MGTGGGAGILCRGIGDHPMLLTSPLLIKAPILSLKFQGTGDAYDYSSSNIATLSPFASDSIQPIRHK